MADRVARIINALIKIGRSREYDPITRSNLVQTSYIERWQNKETKIVHLVAVTFVQNTLVALTRNCTDRLVTRYVQHCSGHCVAVSANVT